MIKSLFHYTNIESVISIIKKKALWLTEIRYLNDTKEFFDGLEILRNKLFNSPDLEKYDERINHDVRHYINWLTNNNDLDSISMSSYFVFSLSQKVDSLSQWRSYGSYAIEFDYEMLIKNLPSLTECIYSPERKNEIATEFMENTILKIKMLLTESNSILDTETYNEIKKINDLAATFKHDGFNEEKEWRALIHKQALHGYANKDINFRSKNEMLIPYIEVPFELDCIKAIHIGPMQDQGIAVKSMVAFLSHIRRDTKDIYVSKDHMQSGLTINVKPSDIPYRG